MLYAQLRQILADLQFFSLLQSPENCNYGWSTGVCIHCSSKLVTYCLGGAVTRHRSAWAGHELVYLSISEYMTYGSSFSVTTRSRHFCGRPSGGERLSPGHAMSSIVRPSFGRHCPICTSIISSRTA